MTKEEELKELREKNSKYKKIIIKEREIKDSLVKKLELIEYLVNLPVSDYNPLKALRLDFLSSLTSLQTVSSITESDILKQIRELFN